MVSTVVLLCVSVIAAGVVIVAFRERSRLASEVNAVVSGIEERTAPQGESVSRTQETGSWPSPHVRELLDEAVQVEQCNLAVLAVNELTGRAVLARNRGVLLSRGLARIALLSGGGGAFVLVAAGSFQREALMQGGASVLIGLSSSFLCQALTANVRRLARKYCDVTEALARQLDRQIRNAGPA